MKAWEPKPLRAKKTGSGEWWVTERNDSDHDFEDEYEPIFESSGTGLNFEEYAKLFAASPAMFSYLDYRVKMYGDQEAKSVIERIRRSM